MNIPIATITDTNVDAAIILNDTSYNAININTEAKQIINQMAFLEVSHQYDPFSETQVSENMERGGNYDRDTLIMNFSISRFHNNNRSLSLPSSTIYDYYVNSPTPTSRDLNSRNYEGKIILYFFLFFILMIIILNKTL